MIRNLKAATEFNKGMAVSSDVWYVPVLLDISRILGSKVRPHWVCKRQRV
jgi:hypothetical protein